MGAVGAPAQDHRIATFQAECACVGGDVGPALIDHADDAQRRPHPFDVKAVRTVPFGDDRTDRVGQFGDGADAVRHGGDTVVGQFQPVQERAGETASAGGFHVLGIGAENIVPRCVDLVGHGAQRGVLRFRRRDGQRCRGGAGA